MASILNSREMNTNHMLHDEDESKTLTSSEQQSNDIGMDRSTDLDTINVRIKSEICYDTIERLRDVNLFPYYQQSPAVQERIRELRHILNRNLPDVVGEDTKTKIIQEYMSHLIPPGTKGAIRGNVFNKIVKNRILTLGLDTQRFDIAFEQQCHLCQTSEKPDWYILDKTTNRVLIGMNQLDCWSGGQQTNRGSKYILESAKYNDDNKKLVCVVCNDVELRSKKNKVFSLVQTGFQNKTLCYINGLHSIIQTFFRLV